MVHSKAPSAESIALQGTITREGELIEQFVSVLKHEQSLLSQGSADELPALTEQKNRLVVQLNQLAAQRNASLTALGYTADRSGIEAWCEEQANRPEMRNAWGRILMLAGEARELNRLNGDLIVARMQYNAKALEALAGARSSLELYGPDGQSTKSGNRRINDAV